MANNASVLRSAWMKAAEHLLGDEAKTVQVPPVWRAWRYPNTYALTDRVTLSAEAYDGSQLEMTAEYKGGKTDTYLASTPLEVHLWMQSVATWLPIKLPHNGMYELFTLYPPSGSPKYCWRFVGMLDSYYEGLKENMFDVFIQAHSFERELQRILTDHVHVPNPLWNQGKWVGQGDTLRVQVNAPWGVVEGSVTQVRYATGTVEWKAWVPVVNYMNQFANIEFAIAGVEHHLQDYLNGPSK